MKNINELTKEYGFYQHKAMAKKFQNNNIIVVRNGNSWNEHCVYILNNTKIECLAENTKYGRLKNAKEIINYIYFKKDSELCEKLKSKNIDLKIFLENYLTNGYNSAVVMRLINRNCDLSKYIENMKIANNRHNNTAYDLIVKKNMNDYEVRTLRRFFS